MPFFPARTLLQSIKYILPFKKQLDIKQWSSSPKLMFSMLFNIPAKSNSLLNELSLVKKCSSSQLTSIPLKNFIRNYHFTSVSNSTRPTPMPGHFGTSNGSNLLKNSHGVFISEFQIHNTLGMFSIRNKKVRDYFPHPNEMKRIKKHGWKKRMSTRAGRLIIMNRILKMRHVLTH